MAMTGGTAKLLKTGNLGGSSSGQVKLYAYYKSTQDSTNNKSTVYCGLYITVTSGWTIGKWTDSGGSYIGKTSLTFDGTVPASTTGTYWLVENKTFTVNHNADGTGSATIYWKWGVNSSWGEMVNPSGSFSITLPTIARQSQVYGGNAQVGSAATLTIVKAASSFTHTLKYKIEGQSSFTTIVTKTDASSYKWTIPTTAYNYMAANSKTVDITIQCITYNGNTQVGSATTCLIVANAKESACAPTVSSTITDTNSYSTALTGNNATIIKGFNTMSVALSATAKNGATISSYKTTCGDKKLTSATGTMSNVESNVFDIVVVDSRGFRTEMTETHPTVNYTKPTISFSASAVLNEDKINISLDISGKYFNGSFGATSNSMTLQYRYKASDSSTWAGWYTLTPTFSGANYSWVGTLLNFNYKNSYTLQCRVQDKVCKDATGYLSPILSAQRSVQCKPIFDWSDSDFNFNIPVTLPQNKYKGDGTYGLDANNSDLINLNCLYFQDACDGANEGINFYRDGTNNDVFKAQGGVLKFVPNYPSSTTEYTVATTSNLNTLLKENTTIIPKLYYKAGDSVTFNTAASFSGYVTSSKTDIFIGIPLAKPTIGVDNVAVTGTIQIRGVNGYVQNTNDSSSSTYNLTSPVGFTKTVTFDTNMVCLRLTMTSDLTNATNNTPIAVRPYTSITVAFS